MRKLNLDDFILAESAIWDSEIRTWEYKLMVGNNEFRFRIIGKECWETYLASVIYSVWGTYADSKSKMEYVFNSIKDKETAVKVLNEFISKMIRDGKTFYNIMDKYEIHYK